MSESKSLGEVAERRALLLVELLIQDLKADFISRPDGDLRHDFLVGFSNTKAGTNTFVVQVKATEKPITSGRYSISRDVFDHLAYSNVPALLIVVDVKRNKLYYAWLQHEHTEVRNGTVLVSLTEIDSRTMAGLRTQLTRVYSGHAVAG
jgi:hypothetical protein